MGRSFHQPAAQRVRHRNVTRPDGLQQSGHPEQRLSAQLQRIAEPVVHAAQNYVGVPNSSRFPSFFSLDAHITKDFRITDKYTGRFGVSGSNLTDHFNPISVHANTGDPAYGVFFGEYRRRYTADFDVLF